MRQWGSRLDKLEVGFGEFVNLFSISSFSYGIFDFRVSFSFVSCSGFHALRCMLVLNDVVAIAIAVG